MELLKFDRIFIESSQWDTEVSRQFRSTFPSEIIERVTVPPRSGIDGQLSAREFNRSKREVYLTEFKGSFFKRCPGSKPGLACCNYYVLNLGLQCDMNCSYCYLQSFINSPVLTIYTNLDKALDELREIGASGASSQALRIGTGETIDSLSLDEYTLYSRRLIDFFKDYPAWRLEFKTKSAKVDQFLNMEHAGNTIVSWSINPQAIISHEEHGTASLDERLTAAEKCLAHGYQIAFHIDPMIWHPEWKDNYRELVHELHRRFSPKDVPYLSLGALRFKPEQRAMMRERFGLNSYVTQAEMFSSEGGKLRYDQSLRSEMFSFVLQEFRALDPAWKVFLCMETPETWLANYSSPPRRVEGIRDLFAPLKVERVSQLQSQQ